MKGNGRSFRKRFLGVVYFVCVLCIIGASFYIYGAWWKRYLGQRPGVVVAKPHVHSDQIPVEAALLWREQVVKTPYKGRVRYPGGQGPFFVGTKGTIATISAPNGKTYALQVEKPGFFLAALDGLEGKWNYNTLWRGSSRFPQIRPLQFIPEGTMLEKGDAVGKIVYQPQPLRAVIYVQTDSGLKAEIADHRIALKKKEEDLPFEVEVRAANSLGRMVKLYLTVPFFPKNRILSRKENFFLYLGEKKGVVVPESAVSTKEGRLWVYVVKGDSSLRREIKGVPLQEDRFLVTGGVEPGEMVLVDSDKGKGGVVRIW
ncbi:MAG: hypothetical protein ACLFN0_01295 [Thermovirgaceae bacterium]